MRQIEVDRIRELRRKMAVEMRLERERMETARENFPRIKAAMERYLESERRVRAARTQETAAPIRQWSMERAPQFERVAPAERTSSYMSVEWSAICLNGEMLSSEAVAELAALAYSEKYSMRLLGSVAWLAMPTRNFPADEFPKEETLMLWLLSTDKRPVDLETLINAATVGEYVAAHTQGAAHVGRMMAVVAMLWWAAGQPARSRRAMVLAHRLAPGWELTELMAQVIHHRGKPEWMME